MDVVPPGQDDWAQLREAVLERDDCECQFCGLGNAAHQQEFDQELHAHHLLPRQEGGRDHKENLLTVCLRCHRTIEVVTVRAVTARVEAVRTVVGEMRAHAQADRERVCARSSVPEIRAELVPWWRQERFSEWERTLYALGRVEALTLWADEVADALRPSDEK
jgi:hypothetical protein